MQVIIIAICHVGLAATERNTEIENNTTAAKSTPLRGRYQDSG